MAEYRGGGKAREILAAATKLAPKGQKMGVLYEEAFKYLTRKQSAEYVYKNALLQRNVLSRHGSKRSRVIFEFRAGQSKLDALVVRESMHAYEIKTELDHFRRLSTQIHDYRQRFAHVWVFVSEKHVSRIEKLLSPDVGVAFMGRNHTFRVVRDALRNTEHLRSEKILECLRRIEYLEVLREFGFSDENIPNTRLFREAMGFASSLDPELVHEATLSQLRGRPQRLSADSLSRVPIYLRAAAVAANYSDGDVDHLLINLADRCRPREVA